MTMQEVKSSIHIDSYEDLMKYIGKLPRTAQLRFLSATSLRGTFGVIAIVYSEADQYVLLTPYIRSKSRKKIRSLDIIENPANAAIRCVQKESGLEVTSLPLQLGFPKEVRNSNRLRKSFSKYTMLITGFSGLLKRSEEIVSEKNISPVWVKRKLLMHIFETGIYTKFEEHPQAYAYNQFRMFPFVRP